MPEPITIGVPDYQGDFISDDTLKAWTMQITLGGDVSPKPKTALEKRTFKALTKNVADIKARGGIVEIPFDLPG